MKIIILALLVLLIPAEFSWAQTQEKPCNVPAPSTPLNIGEIRPGPLVGPLVGPLIYDLGNDGIALRDYSDGVFFDMDNDGVPEQTSWVGGKDGFLVLDINCNNIIDNRSEIFGSIHSTSYRRLYQYDENEDNIIDKQDAIWSYLKIWIDKNVNGKTEKGELNNIEILELKDLNIFYNSYQYISENQPHEKPERINSFFTNIIRSIITFFKGV